MLYLIYYLIGINIIAFIFFGVDKRKAIKNKWRIKESLLLLFSLIGGGIGSLFGIYLFHHKTKKRKFIKVENKRTRNNKKDHKSGSIFSVDGNSGNLANR